MDGIGEGDIDIIKAPIVIDNVSISFLAIIIFITGFWTHESRHWRRARAISCFQLIVSSLKSLMI